MLQNLASPHKTLSSTQIKIDRDGQYYNYSNTEMLHVRCCEYRKISSVFTLVFLKEREADKSPTFKNMLRSLVRKYPRQAKNFWILDSANIKASICFSANVRQCNIAYNVVNVHVQLCFKSFLFAVMLLSMVAANSIKRICASGWFV